MHIHQRIISAIPTSRKNFSSDVFPRAARAAQAGFVGVKDRIERDLRTSSRTTIFWEGAALFFSFAAVVFLFSMPNSSLEAENHLPAAAVGAATASSTQVTEMLIANNGLVVLRNARVDKVEDTTFTVVAAWGDAEFVWEIRTSTDVYGPHNLGTHFLNHDGEEMYAGSIRKGDYITVTGALDEEAKKPTVIAKVVRRAD